MIITAKIYKADTPNANGYTFTEEALQNAVKEFGKREHFAVGGDYPPKISTHDASVDNILGVVTLEYDNGYVEATINPYPVAGAKFREVMKGCADVKVMPIGAGRLESVDNVDMIIRSHYITHVVCTCQDLNCGGVDKELFVADITEE